jgi:hypothetical protein
MRKLSLITGMGIGFIVGSWAGRGPFEQLESGARSFMKQPKVQTTLRSAADGAAAVRDASLEAATGALDETTQNVQKVAAKVSNGS